MNNQSQLSYVTHLKATVTSGIEVVDYIDYPDAEWELCLEDFLSELPYAGKDDEMFFIATPDDLEVIKKDYSVTC